MLVHLDSLTTEHLSSIAARLSSDKWEVFALLYLNLHQEEMENFITPSQRTNPTQLIVQLLTAWKDENGSDATVMKLYRLLRDAQHRGMVTREAISALNGMKH